MPRLPWRYLSLFIDLVLIVDESVGHRGLVPSVDIGSHLRATDTEAVSYTHLTLPTTPYV